MNRLAGRRIMVVEDSYLLAEEVRTALADAGAEMIGPYATALNAQRGVQQSLPDCAVLDVNLGEAPSFDLARTLRMRGVPFLFFTGYDVNALPPEFNDVERLEKPGPCPWSDRQRAACIMTVPSAAASPKSPF